MIKSENLASQIFIEKLELLFIPQGRPVPRKATIKRSSVLKSEVNHVFSSPFVISDNNYFRDFHKYVSAVLLLFLDFQQYLACFVSNFRFSQ